MDCPGCGTPDNFETVDCPALWKPKPGETTLRCLKCNKTFNARYRMEDENDG